MSKPTIQELQAYLDSEYIPPNQPAPQATNPQLHTFSNLNWQTEDEPNPTKPTQLYHLMTVTGHLLIGTYPEDHELNQPTSHYVAWAPLSAEPILTLH